MLVGHVEGSPQGYFFIIFFDLRLTCPRMRSNNWPCRGGPIGLAPSSYTRHTWKECLLKILDLPLQLFQGICSLTLARISSQVVDLPPRDHRRVLVDLMLVGLYLDLFTLALPNLPWDRSSRIHPFGARPSRAWLSELGLGLHFALNSSPQYWSWSPP